jgi:putative flippase GtrA
MISKQFLIFVAVGAGCALIDIGLMQLLIKFGIYYLVATTLGFFVGLVANFLLHTHVTFGVNYSNCALFRFATVVMINYSLTLSSVYIFQIGLNMPLLGKLISLPFVAISGFLLSKNWVYK